VACWNSSALHSREFANEPVADICCWNLRFVNVLSHAATVLSTVVSLEEADALHSRDMAERHLLLEFAV